MHCTITVSRRKKSMSYDEEEPFAVLQLETLLELTDQFWFDNLDFPSSDNAQTHGIPPSSGCDGVPAHPRIDDHAVREASQDELQLRHGGIEHFDRGGSGDEPKELKGTQDRRKIHLECAKKRRNIFREKLRRLHELLPNTSTKLDQATLLDEAAKQIKFLQCQLQTMRLLWAQGICPCHVATTPAVGAGFTGFHQPPCPSFFCPPWM